MLEREVLQKRIRILLIVVMVVLIVSGLLALCVPCEVAWLERVAGEESAFGQRFSEMGKWMTLANTAIIEISEKYDFFFYGTDWMAFCCIVGALAFIGPLRDPVRNIWLIEFSLVVSLCIFPMALISGTSRGIPLGWVMGDAVFGIAGGVLFWFVRSYTMQLASPESPPPSD